MLVHHKFRGSVPLVLAMVMGAHLPAAARGQGIQPHVPVSTTLGDIARLRAAYVDALNANDAKALSAMYTTDAIVVGADGAQATGARAVAKMLADAAADGSQATLASSSVKVYGTTAIDVGTFTVHTKAGADVMNRYLVVLRHGVTGWKFQNLAVIPMGK